jgi:large subunit ribosomal protein L5
MSEESAYQPRLRVRYEKEIAPALMKRFSYTNRMQVPRLKKIVINMGMGEAVTNPKLVDAAVVELTAITGQKPIVTRAKKAIATFKLRENMPIVMVTLRRERMGVLGPPDARAPRVRDFAYPPLKSTERRQLTPACAEQIVFLEIDFDGSRRPRMNVTIVTTAETTISQRALATRCRSGASHGACQSMGQSEPSAEIFHACHEPLQGLRQASRVLSRLWTLPNVPPAACVARGASRRDQGELVTLPRKYS